MIDNDTILMTAHAVFASVRRKILHNLLAAGLGRDPTRSCRDAPRPDSRNSCAQKATSGFSWASGHTPDTNATRSARFARLGAISQVRPSLLGHNGHNGQNGHNSPAVGGPLSRTGNSVHYVHSVKGFGGDAAQGRRVVWAVVQLVRIEAALQGWQCPDQRGSGQLTGSRHHRTITGPWQDGRKRIAPDSVCPRTCGREDRRPGPVVGLSFSFFSDFA
jgi:hypothetical protein